MNKWQKYTHEEYKAIWTDWLWQSKSIATNTEIKRQRLSTCVIFVGTSFKAGMPPIRTDIETTKLKPLNKST